MDYSFQHLKRDAELPPRTLRLMPASEEDEQRREVALLAVQRGLGGFVHNVGPIERLELPASPTLDDMLAAEFVTLLAAGKPLPAGAKAFAKYAGLAREGLRPGKLPLESSLAGIFQAVRNSASEHLDNPAGASAFLSGWRRMWERIHAAAEKGQDPFTELLFDDPEFARERAYLADDQRAYHQDVARGEKWLVSIPEGPPRAAALILRQPKSLLFKYWCREDQETPTGQPYLLLGVLWNETGWIFSTDPVQRLSLKSLAERLQQEEVRQDAQRAAVDPWFDGLPFGHSLVAEPKQRSVLSERKILEIVKAWSGALVMSQDTSPAWARPAVAAAALVVAAISAFAFWPDDKPAPNPLLGEIPPAVDSAPPIVATVNAQPVHRSLARLNESVSVPVSSLELQVTPRPGTNDIAFTVQRHVNQPVRLWVSCTPAPDSSGSIWLKVNNQPASELLCNPIGTGGIQSQPLSAMLKAHENTLQVTLECRSAQPNPTTVRVHWEADHAVERDLLLLAVGVSDYDPPTPQLPCAVSDATELVRVFQGQTGKLFRSVLIDPALHDGPALNEQATRNHLLDRLGWLKTAAEQNRNCLAVVTLSGHGKTFDNAQQGSYYYLAHQYDTKQQLGRTALGWAECLDYFKSMPCPVVVVIDTCHAGAALTRSENPRAELERAVASAMQALAKSENGIVVVAACRSDQLAAEAAGWNHGALTLAILELLSRQKLYDGPTKSNSAQLPTEKPVITLEDLQRYATDRVEDLVGQSQAVVVKSSDGLFLRDIPLTALNRPEPVSRASGP